MRGGKERGNKGEGKKRVEIEREREGRKNGGVFGEFKGKIL